MLGRMTQPNTHEAWMKLALTLARRGIGTTHPNPRVGAVIVCDGELVGQGWHARPGGPHAEIHALQDAGERAAGATAYVTLEPCAAHGRTPPCTEALIRAGIRRVVYASDDPNPQMAGGAASLRAAGIEVLGGVLAAEAGVLNRPFFHYVRTGLPYIRAKAAISLDGKLATHTGHSQWISSVESRTHAHRLRAACDAVIIGAATFIEDRPSLTVRHVPCSRQPLRVVIARKAPPFRADDALLDGRAPSRMYVEQLSDEAGQWRQAGMEVIAQDGLESMLRHLAAEGYLDVLLEGGGRLHAHCLQQRLSCEMWLYQAPILIGGTQAVSLWHGQGVARVEQALQLADIEYVRLGRDQLIHGRIIYPD